MADENDLVVYMYDCLPEPRGGGNMRYYPPSHPAYNDGDKVGNYSDPRDYGGWLSSGSTQC